MAAETTLKKLIDAATEVRLHARADYSGFKVGAALEDSEGRIWTGCNVESSSYSMTICAERVALVKAISEGASGFTRLVITASGKLGDEPVTPCGACRQLLYDYARNVEVWLINPETGQQRSYPLKDLYPYPFGGEMLKEGESA